MTPRNRLASQIYQRLIFQDLDAALENPMPAAHRALLLADAFVVCAAPTTPGSAETFSLEVAIESNDHCECPGVRVRTSRVSTAPTKHPRAN